MITLRAAVGLAPRAVLIYCSCIASLQTPHRLTRLRPLAAIAAGVCVWLTTGAAWPGRVLVAAAVQSPVASIRPSLPALSAFRLGTAAGFLGWSTATFRTLQAPIGVVPVPQQWAVGSSLVIRTRSQLKHTLFKNVLC